MKKLVTKLLIRLIKKRVLKRTQQTGGYEHVISFIINAPLKEWRVRLWLVENVRDDFGYCCTDEATLKWLISR